MFRQYKILDILKEFDKVPDPDWSILYDSRENCDVSKKLLKNNLINLNEEIYVYVNCDNIIEMTIRNHDLRVKSEFKIDFDEFINYKRTQLIDKMLC